MTQEHLIPVGILADDLTSATDAAMAFLGKTASPPKILRCIADIPTAPVVAVDIDSRAEGAMTAAARVTRGITALAHRSILLKTIDSTLRGHARAEIAAAFRASGRKRLVIAPAFPAAGRITRGGWQYVHGVPVDESPYAADPVHPARTARIADLLDPDFGPVRVLPAIGGNPGAARVLILDAARQEDLNAQVRDLGDPSDVLWVGSPGLAIALAELLPTQADALPTPPPPRRSLIVAGSANPTTHAQCDRLVAAGVPVVTDLARMPAGAVICLAAPRHRQAVSPLMGLADQAADALMQGGFDGLIATGGETMAAILGRLGITRLDLNRALEPGFPAGLAGHAGRNLTLAMKAGGFGDPETLLRAVTLLMDGEKNHHG